MAYNYKSEFMTCKLLSSGFEIQIRVRLRSLGMSKGNSMNVGEFTLGA